MRVVPCLLVIAWLCLGTTGCSLFNKRPKEGSSGTKTPTGAREPAKFPGAGDPIRDSSSTNSSRDLSGILAGTVIDEGNGHPKDAYIRWVSLDEPGKKDEAPIDVAVLSDGSFMIRGLKPNQHYKLMARAKVGERMLAGIQYATVPNTRVLIVIKASLANAETPPLPPPPAFRPKQEEPKKASARPGERPALTTGPGWNSPAPSAQGPASIDTPRALTPVPDLPARVNIPSPPPPSKAAPAVQTGGWVPGIAATEIVALPTAQIPNPLNTPPPIRIEKPVALPAPPAPSGLLPSTSVRVPSCVLVGRHLINFALYDLNHQPWEYKQKKGKLVLLDFWGSWCVPCRKTIPHLVNLQSRYGTSGLEVIGLAYEQAGSFQEKANRVGNACQAQRINYRVLLGSEGACPVRTEFAVSGLPTLILLDERGWIIWRQTGEPDRGALEELEFAIKSRLQVP